MGNSVLVAEINKAQPFKFHPGLTGWGVHMGKIPERMLRSRSQNRDLGKQDSHTTYMNTLQFERSKE